MEENNDTTTQDTHELPAGRVDVAVVGGGLAGLTAAAFAARSGARTVVIEANGLGGRARTDERNGVFLNRGPHALYLNGVGTRILRELGIHPKGGVPTAAGPGFGGSRTGELPLGTKATLTTKLLSPRSRVAFAAFMTKLPKLDTASLRSLTVGEYIDDLTDREDLRALLHAVVRLSTYANAPDHMSAGAAIDQLVLALGGVRYLDRGWAPLVGSLATTARNHGAAIVSGTPVRGLESGGDGVRLDTPRGEVDARSVVLAGLAPEAVERLSGVAEGELRAMAGPDARAACLDLVLAERPPHTFSLELDHDLYYSVHTEVADLAPDGLTLASLAHYRRPDEDGDPVADKAVLVDYARRLGIDESVDERYLHDMVVTNGVPLAARGGSAGRPGVDVLATEQFGVENVLIAGDWIGDEGMLADVSIATGARAGALAAKRSSRVTA